jgi:hypothetical protein
MRVAVDDVINIRLVKRFVDVVSRIPHEEDNA